VHRGGNQYIGNLGTTDVLSEIKETLI